MNLAAPGVLDLAGITGMAVAAYLLIHRIWTVLRSLGAALRRLGHLADDWFGEPERDGIPARPGVIERIAAIETTSTRLLERVERVEHELHPNSGESLRDAIDRVETALAPPSRHPDKKPR